MPDCDFDRFPPPVAVWEWLMNMKPALVQTAVWQGGVALALERHPNSPYPQPQDLADAVTVLAAAAPGVL